MKKNRMMRLASILLVCVLLTTSVISGTFAKYTTEVNSDDKARVAYWGFQSSNSMDITGLFKDVYGNVDSINGDDVIAPGTTGSADFTFAWDEDVSAYGSPVAVTGPEVSYNFAIKVDAVCDPLIKKNKSITWSLDNKLAPAVNGFEEGSFDALIVAIRKLSGSQGGQQVYGPNTLPDAFSENDDKHTISWTWAINGSNTYEVDGETLTQDQYDTYMGNAANLDDVSIEITITATQVD